MTMFQLWSWYSFEWSENMIMNIAKLKFWKEC